MIEVEAKIKIENPEKFREKVQKIARYRGAEKKIDDYYALQNDGKYPLKSLRIRRRNGLHGINFKQRIFFKEGIYAKKETEFKVSDINGFLGLIEDFGFKKWLRKEKYTEIYEIGKNFHIELNNVKKLGWFLEIEYLTGEKGIEKAKSEVLLAMENLGISKRDIVADGYTKMLWDMKKG